MFLLFIIFKYKLLFSSLTLVISTANLCFEHFQLKRCYLWHVMEYANKYLHILLIRDFSN